MKLQQISWTSKDAIEIRYGNGAVFSGDCTELPENIYTPCDAARHGIAQKLGDAKSGGTAGEKHAEVVEIWAALKGGSWNRKGTTGGVAVFIGPAYLILAEKAGATEEQAAEWLEAYLAMSEERQAEIRAKPFMKAAIETARANAKMAVATGGGKAFDPNE
jgi:hypothetical protein